MIKITAEDIKLGHGMLGAISRASVRTVRDLLGGLSAYPPRNLDRVTRLFAHKNPHIDEYMAMLLFKAAMPERYWSLPFEEFVLSHATDDTLARATWPNAAVFGMGATHNGGARAAILYDEHVPEGKTRKSTSATKLVMEKLFGDRKIPRPVSRVCKEVDHIDAYAGAHPNSLSTYVKLMNNAEFFLQRSQSGIMRDGLTPAWKQAIVEACLVAVMLGIADNKKFYFQDYWRAAAEDSLRHYESHTLLRDDADFRTVWERYSNNILKFWNAPLKIKDPSGKLQNVTFTDKHGKVHKDNQFLIVPFLAALCQEYWGPEVGQLILVHLWETGMLSQLDFALTQREVINATANGAETGTKRTAAGFITFIKGRIPVPDSNGDLREPWIIEIHPAGGVNGVKNPLMNFLKEKNDGIGYVIIRNSTGTIMLNRGKNTNMQQWTAVTDWLLSREGCSDAREAGCWHKTENADGIIADFLLNGNEAHQYVPRSELTAQLLADFLSGDI